jgi:hypothetical protein
MNVVPHCAVRYEFIAGNMYKGRPILEVNATTGVLSAAQDLYYVRGMRNYNLTLRIFNNNTESIKGPQNAEQIVNITLIILPVHNPPIVSGDVNLLQALFAHFARYGVTSFRQRPALRFTRTRCTTTLQLAQNTTQR